MASKIKVDQIEGSSGSSITIPTGQTLTITDGLAASAIGSGTLAEARLPTATVAKGGTNLTSFTTGDILYATGATTLAKLPKGTGTQVLAMNSGATAPEWIAQPSGVWEELKNVNDTVSQAYLDLTDCFSSSYDFYKLFVEGYQSDTNNERFAMQFLSGSGSGTLLSSSEYDSTTVMGHVESTNTTATVTAGTYAGTQFNLGSPTTTAGVWKGHYDITIYAAYLGTGGHYKSVTWNAHTNENNQNKQRIGAGGGMFKNHTSATGIRLKTESGGASSFSCEKVQLIGLKTA